MTIDTVSVPPAEPARPGEPPATATLDYDGRTGELARLWIKVLLLDIVTLGFYRFWGRTRIRKYLWNHVSLLGDRFEYDGTGGELFVRFLIAIVVLLPLLFVAQFAVLLGLGRVWAIIIQVAAIATLIFLSFVAYYGSYRYRLSRSLWRGMRGGLDGSSSGFALRVIGLSLLLPLTLYLYLPWWLVRQWNYVVNHAGFGNEMFRSKAAGRQLFKPYLVAYFAGWLTLAVFAGIMIAAIAPMVTQAVKHRDTIPDFGLARLWPALAAGYLALIIGNLAGGIYFYARTMSYLASSISFGNVQISADVRAWPLFRLLLGNMLITLPTLGLGAPFAAQRYVRFLCRRLVLHDLAELQRLSQDPGRRPRRGGEGLLQMLDGGGLT